MNLTSAQFFNKGSQLSRLRGPKLFAILSVFLLTAVPVMAEPVTIKQVVQTLSSSKAIPDLRLNTLVAQDPVAKVGTPPNGPRNDKPAGTPESIIPGVVVGSDVTSLGVDIVEEGEVEGTICDCGEILIAGGGFPKWPFMLLAAVPLVFIHDCDCDESTSSSPTPTPPSTPTPTPPTTPTPEPASLFLLGSGLVAAGAGLRRRYGKAKLTEQTENGEGE